MERKRSIFTFSVIAFLIILISFSTNVLGEEVTIKGKVNAKYQIVTEDGQIYEVGYNDKGDEVVFQHVGKIVKVSGTIEKSDEGKKTITVTSCEVEDIE